MHQTKFALTALTLAALTTLAGCGGAGPGESEAEGVQVSASSGFSPGIQTLKPRFSAQVTFGDSLSDVGTYAVGTIAALGGGEFTINGDNTAINPALTGKNWTELMAAQFGLPAPCAAETGLKGTTTGFMVPIVMHAGCFGYAQGGARITELIGPGNSGSGQALKSFMGSLTVPVAGQISHHLSTLPGGKFKGDEIVLVMAGGNDAIYMMSQLEGAAKIAGEMAFAEYLFKAAFTVFKPTTAAAVAFHFGSALATEQAKPAHTLASLHHAVEAENAKLVKTGQAPYASLTSLVAQAKAAGIVAGNAYYIRQGQASMVPQMAKAGANLAALVKTQLLANGAKYVTVNNLPDLASTPLFLSYDPAIKALINAMMSAFNTELRNGFEGESRVLLVDMYTASHDQALNPGAYGLSNVTDTACDLTTAKNILHLSLVCNASNLKPGDVSHYAYADAVHPTPYNHALMARYVSEKMLLKGWL